MDKIKTLNNEVNNDLYSHTFIPQVMSNSINKLFLGKDFNSDISIQNSDIEEININSSENEIDFSKITLGFISPFLNKNTENTTDLPRNFVLDYNSFIGGVIKSINLFDIYKKNDFESRYLNKDDNYDNISIALKDILKDNTKIDFIKCFDNLIKKDDRGSDAYFDYVMSKQNNSQISNFFAVDLNDISNLNISQDQICFFEEIDSQKVFYLKNGLIIKIDGDKYTVNDYDNNLEYNYNLIESGQFNLESVKVVKGSNHFLEFLYNNGNIVIKDLTKEDSNEQIIDTIDCDKKLTGIELKKNGYNDCIYISTSGVSSGYMYNMNGSKIERLESFEVSDPIDTNQSIKSLKVDFGKLVKINKEYTKDIGSYYNYNIYSSIEYLPNFPLIEFRRKLEMAPFPGELESEFYEVKASDSSNIKIYDKINNIFYYVDNSTGNIKYIIDKNDSVIYTCKDGNLSSKSIFDEDNISSEQYGGDQGAFSKNAEELLKDPYILNSLKHLFPDASMEDYHLYLCKLNTVGCGYTAIVNTLFVEYEGREKEFEEKFGFPMYTIKNNGQLDYNYEYLILEYFNYIWADSGYTIQELYGDVTYDAVDESISGEFGSGIAEGAVPKRYMLFQNFINEKYGQYVHINAKSEYDKYGDFGELTSDNVIDVYNLFKTENNQIIISDEGYDLYNMDGSLYHSNGGAHAMCITGLTDDNRFIVSSWGKQYILDGSKKDSKDHDNEFLRLCVVDY